jgi:peroxiredoxin Q/BCP
VAYFAASIDKPETNRKFAQSLELDYPILSDPGKQVARAYGVLRAMGLFAARHTFYIGVDGKVMYVDTQVKPDTAGEDLVRRLQTLGVERR